MIIGTLLLPDGGVGKPVTPVAWKAGEVKVQLSPTHSPPRD
jgi:hypothetical protein